MIDLNFGVERSQFYRLRIDVGDGMEINVAFDGGMSLEGKKTQLGVCRNMLKREERQRIIRDS